MCVRAQENQNFWDDVGEQEARTWSAKVKRSGGKALEGLGSDEM